MSIARQRGASVFHAGSFFESFRPVRKMMERGGVRVVDNQRSDGDGAVADGGVIGVRPRYFR